MSKIICDVCGTSYPETAVQCPICGCVRPGEVKVVTGDTTIPVEEKAPAAYTHVKGGRFSKSNVRKRNLDKGVENVKATPPVTNDDDENNDAPENNGKNKTDIALTITVIALLLAIVAVVIYIVLRFFAPGFTNKNVETNPSTIATTTSGTAATTLETEATTQPTVTTAEETTEPADETTEPTEETTIPEEETTEPSKAVTETNYTISHDEVTLIISRDDRVRFNLELRDENGDLVDVKWVDDKGICKIEGNEIIAEKEGQTYIYATINGVKYSEYTCYVIVWN